MKNIEINLKDKICSSNNKISIQFLTIAQFLLRHFIDYTDAETDLIFELFKKGTLTWNNDNGQYSLIFTKKDIVELLDIFNIHKNKEDFSTIFLEILKTINYTATGKVDNMLLFSGFKYSEKFFEIYIEKNKMDIFILLFKYRKDFMYLVKDAQSLRSKASVNLYTELIERSKSSGNFINEITFTSKQLAKILTLNDRNKNKKSKSLNSQIDEDFMEAVSEINDSNFLEITKCSKDSCCNKSTSVTIYDKYKLYFRIKDKYSILQNVIETSTSLQAIVKNCSNKAEIKTTETPVERFSQRWLKRGREEADDHLFWIDILLEVLGAPNATERIKFQKKVIVDGHTKKIDAYIPETKSLIEQKSYGIDLDKKMLQSDGAWLTPYEQAFRYNSNLRFSERARWIITSNFKEIWIYDMEEFQPEKNIKKIHISDLVQHPHLLDFLLLNTKEDPHSA